MNSLLRLSSIAALCILAGPGVLRSQWDPTGDARLFRYVFDYPEHYINDHSLIRVDSLWHLYFIDGKPSSNHVQTGRTRQGEPMDGEPFAMGDWSRAGNEVRIGHATSPDLITWTPRDSALSVGPPGALDGAHVYAPSVIESGGRYYMIYTGNQIGFACGEHLFLATSTDLYHWTRYQPDPIFAPDTSWAAYIAPGPARGEGGPRSGRDPHLFRDDRHGFILYYVARLRGSSAESVEGAYSCVAAATSPDLIHWTDHGPLLVRRTYQMNGTLSWSHPESPCVVRRGDDYYLFWKGGEGMRYVRSNDPLDFTGADEHRLATSHASKIVQHDSAWYVTSCSRDIDDISHTLSDRTRGLFLAGIRWEGELPRVVPLDGITGVHGTAETIRENPARPNPVRRGESLFVGIGERSGGEHDVTIVDPRSIEIVHERIASIIDADGRRVVEIPTADLPPGIYFVRIGTTVARVVVF